MFLTSRYPVRTGLLAPTGPAHVSGIKSNEVTLPEALKALGLRQQTLTSEANLDVSFSNHVPYWRSSYVQAVAQ